MLGEAPALWTKHGHSGVVCACVADELGHTRLTPCPSRVLRVWTPLRGRGAPGRTEQGPPRRAMPTPPVLAKACERRGRHVAIRCFSGMDVGEQDDHIGVVLRAGSGCGTHGPPQLLGGDFGVGRSPGWGWSTWCFNSVKAAASCGGAGRLLFSWRFGPPSGPHVPREVGPS